MKYIEKALIWLSGKKGIIASLLQVINAYLWNKGIYQEIDFAFVSAIVVIIFGVASYKTQQIYKK